MKQDNRQAIARYFVENLSITTPDSRHRLNLTTARAALATHLLANRDRAAFGLFRDDNPSDDITQETDPGHE